MTFSEKGDTVTLTMTQSDYLQLLLILGYATGSAKDPTTFRSFLRFTNELNRTNPRFTPYELGPEAER